MSNKKYVIATIKSWNIDRANDLKNKAGLDIEIITDHKKLNYANIKRIDPKYIFFPHWSWKIPEEIYENWECVVFHMTDLPFGRGGSPLQNLIERGIYKTKISAIRVVKKIDAGPVYLKNSLDLNGSAEEIFVKAADIIFGKMIKFIIRKVPVPKPQKGQPVIFKRRIPDESDMSGLNSLTKVYDHIRMLDAEGYPNAFLDTKYLRFEFTKAVKRKDGIIQADVKIKSRKR